MNTSDRKLRVFLCHASQDKPVVRELYQRLLTEGWIDPWLDEEKLLPGQDWDMEIEKAVEEADVILVCLSAESVSKAGYVQKEIKVALNIALYKPEETIFIVPLRLNDCSTPRILLATQYLDYFPASQREPAYKKLRESLSLRFKQIILQNSTVTVENTPSGSKIFIFGGMEFVKVELGAFIMGGNNRKTYDYIVRKHEHGLPYEYWIGRFPVTNEQFAKFAKSTNQTFELILDKISHPVVEVNWYAAHDYINWLNVAYKKELPDGYLFRLPSESEWEKAARGVDGRMFPWGDKFSKNKCNTKESRKNSTTQVNTYSPQGDSPFGVADMAGNVYEWTRQLLLPDGGIIPDFYVGREVEIAPSKSRVSVRGGSWNSSATLARTFSRMGYYPNDSFDCVGFRVVISPMPNR